MTVFWMLNYKWMIRVCLSPLSTGLILDSEMIQTGLRIPFFAGEMAPMGRKLRQE
jgi:hypothetical protein